jgi:probable LLM family oxidoreductase
VQDLVEEIVVADQGGLDVFGVGEHHRPDFVVSAPAVVLGAAAQATQRIRLSSAVTVLSSDDPIRVFQDFATLDLISGGRAEIMAGRGSFIESFPLFGYDLDDYDTLFADKLERLLAIRAGERVNGLTVHPRPLQDPLPVWLAVGGNPGSAIRAGTLGLPLALAIIGGYPERFVALVDLYRESAATAGHEAVVAINSHGYVAPTSKQAADEFYPAYATMMNRIGRERGWSPMTRAQFDEMRGPRGSLLVGSPQEVAEKILFERELFGNARFLLQMSVGPIAHDRILRAIELFAGEVVPAVRAGIGAAA